MIKRLLVLVSVMVFFGWTTVPELSHAAAKTPIMAVFPFQNVSGDPNLDWLSLGLAANLAEDLEHIAGVSNLGLDDFLEGIKTQCENLDQACLAKMQENQWQNLANQAGLGLFVWGLYKLEGDEIVVRLGFYRAPAWAIKGDLTVRSQPTTLLKTLSIKFQEGLKAQAVTLSDEEIQKVIALKTGSINAFKMNLLGNWCLQRIMAKVEKPSEAQKCRELLKEAAVFDPQYFPSWNNLAHLAYLMKEYDESEFYLKMVLNRKATLLGGENQEVAAVLDDLAEVYYAKNDYQRAEETLKESLIMKDKLGAGSAISVAKTLEKLGLVFYAQKDYEQAKTSYEDALEIREKVFGQNHRSVAINLQSLGRIHLTLKEFAKAEQMFLQAAAIKEKIYGPQHAETAKALDGLIETYLAADHEKIKLADPNRFLYLLMSVGYLWADQLPKTYNYETATPDKVLKDLMYRERDRWSYIAEKKAYTDLYDEGKSVGLGFGLRWDAEDSLRASLVFPDSPAGQAGVKRGYKILAMNDKTIDQIKEKKLWGILNVKKGDSIKITFEDEAGNKVEKTLNADLVTTKTTFYHTTFDAANKKVGYLFFRSFYNTSFKELTEVFAEFKAQKVEELILDLRYNSGGSIAVSEYLASLIAGKNVTGKVYQTLVFNKNWSYLNEKIKFGEGDWDKKFETDKNSLDLKRLFVITTDSTASASEFLINGLRPYIEVIQIGTKTHGKAVGMLVKEYGDLVISVINFKGLNAKGEGEYYNGLPPTCWAEDDLINQIGDQKEACLGEALYYLENKACRPKLTLRSGPAGSGQELFMEGFRREIGSF